MNESVTSYDGMHTDGWSTTETFETTSVVPKVFNEIGVAVVAGTVLPLGLFGILANGVTIYVIYKSPSLKSVFNYFILSLALSDIISAIFSPFAVYHRTWGFDYWNISSFLCKVFWGVSTGTSVLTSLHITVYAILRFVSLKWPHKFNSYTIRRAKITIILLWIIAFFAGVFPFFLWMTASRHNRAEKFHLLSLPSCGANLETVHIFIAYSIFGFSTFFFLPCILVFLFCGGSVILICARRIRRTRGKQRLARAIPRENNLYRRQKENQAIAQLLLICGSYLLGYLPLCAYQLASLTGTTPRRTLDQHKLSWWIGVGSVITLQFSECLNPIFYNLASSTMRAETHNFLARFCGRRDESSRKIIKVHPPKKPTEIVTVV